MLKNILIIDAIADTKRIGYDLKEIIKRRYCADVTLLDIPGDIRALPVILKQ